MAKLLSRIVHCAVSAAEEQVVLDPRPYNQLMTEGARMYSGWGRRLGYLWDQEHYSHPGFKVRYITEIFERRTLDTLVALKRFGKFQIEQQQALDYDYRALFKQLLREWSTSQLTQDRHVTVNLLSFVCGPGTDCVAQILFWRDYAAEVLGLGLRFKITCVDIVPSWLPSLDAALGQVTTELDTVEFIEGSWDGNPSVLAAVVSAPLVREVYSIVSSWMLVACRSSEPDT